MIVRPIDRGDARAWAGLRAHLWPHAAADELAEEVRAFLNGESVAHVTAAFVAIESDAPVGFVELAVRPFADGCDSAPVPHVEGWYVEPGSRGRGAGRALMDAAEGWAREHGFVELASDTEIHNNASLAAHVRCGFVETERLIKLRKPLR